MLASSLEFYFSIKYFDREEFSERLWLRGESKERRNFLGLTRWIDRQIFCHDLVQGLKIRFNEFTNLFKHLWLNLRKFQ